MAGTGALYNSPIPGPADLPMEETRSRDEVRARLEAKRNKVTTPWGNRPVRTEGFSTTTSTEYVVEPSVDRFAEPEPPEPAPKAPAKSRAPAAPRWDVAGIVESYLAGRSIPQVASQFATTQARVRRILLDTDGLELRGDRAKTARHTRPQPDAPAPPTADQTPALADLLGRARVLVSELETALSRLTFEGDRP